MERNRNIFEIKSIFKENFLGIQELAPFLKKINLSVDSFHEPDIPYSIDFLEGFFEDYILILGLPVSVLDLRKVFGIDPERSEPCFYNQDWYLKEDFVKIKLEFKWYLIRRNILECSRAQQPLDILKNGIQFPSAALSTFTFFAYYSVTNRILWEYDFIWCSDLDHNGDRIYVGKYFDMDGINKNGYSIHRHLSLRSCYASTNFIQ